MGSIFHELISQPLYNVIVLFYNIIPFHDFGISIILVTVLIKTALVPLSKKQIESQKKMQEIQPKLKEIQDRYKDNKEKQSKAVMEFYRENKMNPFSGCLPLIAQLVFLIAFYRIILNISSAGLVVDGGELYAFISKPEEINHFFVGLIDISRPNVWLAFVAAIAQYWQTKMMMDTKKEKKEKEKKITETKSEEPDFAQIMTKQMLYLGPALTFFIGMKFAAGLALYWIASTLFAAFQQIYIFKKK